MTRMGGVLLIAALPSLCGAQALVRVSGVAYDSLSGRPLPSAFVSLGPRSTVADSAGRFFLDSIAPGTHRATLQHDVLDSLGLQEITTSVMIRGADETIRIATPSARTMWRRVCAGEQHPDSGFAFGVVRQATTRKPVAGATIVASWIELRSTGTAVSQKGWRAETRSIDDGTYVLCGLPLGTAVQMSSVQDSSGYAAVEFSLSDRSAVRRQDLSLISIADSNARGILRGLVSADGQPLSNVRIETDGLPEVRTGDDGRFVLRNVRAGTHQVYVQGIGFSPTSRIVEVKAGDTTFMSVTVGKVTLLDSVVVIGKTARARILDRFQDRKRTGLGYYRDSLQLAKFHAWSSVFNEMGSVTVRNPFSSRPSFTIGSCRPEVWVDGVEWDATAFASMRPEDIAAIEVYRPGQIAIDLMAMGVGRPRPKEMGFRPKCAIVVWTKRGTR